MFLGLGVIPRSIIRCCFLWSHNITKKLSTAKTDTETMGMAAINTCAAELTRDHSRAVS